MAKASEMLREKYDTAREEHAAYHEKINERILEGGDPPSDDEKRALKEMAERKDSAKEDYEAQRDLEDMVADDVEYSKRASEEAAKISDRSEETERFRRAARDIDGAEGLREYDELYAAYSGADGRIDIHSAIREENVVRPRERGGARFSYLYELVIGDTLGAPMGSRELPARNVSGAVRDRFRRIADSDPGRVVSGQLYPHGSWRHNDYRPDRIGLTQAEAPLVVGSDQYVKTPETISIKSLVTSQIVGKYFQKHFPDRPHCWLTHRNELHQQSSSRLRQTGLAIHSMTNDPPVSRHWYQGKINVISPSLRSWPELKTAPGIMIVDETHHIPARTWGRLASEWQARGGLVLGFTATPWRMSKRQGFEDWYGKMVQGPSAIDLQANGYLATPRVISPNSAYVDGADAKLASTGDYAFSWMEDEITMLLAHKPVLEHYRKKITEIGLKDHRTMWFVPTVHTAHMLKWNIEQKLGETAKVLTADTPNLERSKMLAALKHRQLTHLISIDVLGEGIDVPSVPIIASLRPTKSVVVWLQQCGRGSRPKTKKGGLYYVFDYARNVERHGPPDLDREWSLKPRQEFESLLPQIIVAKCFHENCADLYLHPAHRECWHCGSPQYYICTACHVARRWTKFARAKDKTCVICAEHMKTEKEKVARSKTRRIERKRSYMNNQRRLHKKIKPYKRNKH